MNSINVNNIKQYLLFGGGATLLECAKIFRNNKLEIAVFTSTRHADEIIYSNKTLVEYLKQEKIEFYITDDINSCKELFNYKLNEAFGLGFGEAWSFDKEIIKQFDGNLFDLMGIRLPRYRGGAHYTWQILRKNKLGACYIQEINEFMVQGEFDNGSVIKSKQYFLPKTARIPLDYFIAAQKEELAFIEEFLEEFLNGVDFIKHELPEHFTIFFPRLNTLRQGFINWNWETTEIETFVCAFDDPYIGASTKLGNQKVFIKSVFADYEDGAFHPFQFGLIYKIYNNAAYVATKSGTIIIEKIIDENNNNIVSKLKHGMRLFTPNDWLESALEYTPIYLPTGLK